MEIRNVKCISVLGVVSVVFFIYTYITSVGNGMAVYMEPEMLHDIARNTSSIRNKPSVLAPAVVDKVNIEPSDEADDDAEDMLKDKPAPDQCPSASDSDFLYESASYLLKDLQLTEKLQRDPPREPGQRGLSFLPNFTNPCWYEELPSKPFQYTSRTWHFSLISKRMIGSIQNRMTPIFRRRQEGDNAVYPNGWRLRCIPYIYILGLHKGGSSDFYKSLVSHPLVRGIVRKEPQFWSRLPIKDAGFSRYLDFYDRVSDEIDRKTDKDGRHPLVTLEASTHTYASYLAWQTLPWVEKYGRQCVTIADHLKYISPKSKHILLIREPVTWIISCYNYFYKQSWSSARRMTNSEITDMIIKHIKEFNSCFSEAKDVINCALKFVNMDRCHMVHTIHYVWVKLWNDVMGPKHFMAISSDDYFHKRSETMGKVFAFLDLPQMDNIESMDARRVQNASPHKKVGLSNSTISNIHKFLKPWNKKLVELTQNESFNWF